MIPVTRTFLPPYSEYQSFLDRIWSSNQISNGGENWHELQRKLCSHLKTDKIILTANGTLPLQIALKNAAENGEVITTPFSYVATSSSIVWENCTPVFVDIHPEFWTIDETKLEEAITHKTTAILATHVFGNPCRIEAIEEIAKKYHLKVIYDGAHCFGVKYHGQSIFNYGDISTCSFHATKLFHTGEGGAMFCKNETFYDRLFLSHNFGHDGPNSFKGLGINAKMSELQAAMGLAVLPYVEQIIYSREKAVDHYNRCIDFSRLGKLKIREGTKWNYCYYPILFRDERNLLKVQEQLNIQNIFPRRYFYPSLNTLNYVSYSRMAVSENIAERVLCLPLFYGIGDNTIEQIAAIVNAGTK